MRIPLRIRRTIPPAYVAVIVGAATLSMTSCTQAPLELNASAPADAHYATNAQALRTMAFYDGEGIGPEVVGSAKHISERALELTGTRSNWQFIDLDGPKLVEEVRGKIGINFVRNADRTHNAPPGSEIARMVEAEGLIKGPNATLPDGKGSFNVAARRVLGTDATIRNILYLSADEVAQRLQIGRSAIARDLAEGVYTNIGGGPRSILVKLNLLYLRLFKRAEYRKLVDPRSMTLGFDVVSEAGTKNAMRIALRYADSVDAKRVEIHHKNTVLTHTNTAYLKWAVDEALSGEFASKVVTASSLKEAGTLEDFQRAQAEGADNRILIVDTDLVDIATARWVDRLVKRELENPVTVALQPGLIGDITTDINPLVAAGSIGMSPGLNLGVNGVPTAEAGGGTAPDIAGRNVANPTSIIASAAMLWRHVGEARAADLIEQALQSIVADGVYTRDMAATLKKDPNEAVTTSGFTAALLQKMEQLAGTH